jgi:hypothetical protein
MIATPSYGHTYKTSLLVLDLKSKVSEIYLQDSAESWLKQSDHKRCASAAISGSPGRVIL